MTLQEAIERADALKPNQYENALKVQWLSVVDGQAFEEVIATHEDPATDRFDPYTAGDMDAELLIAPPHDLDVYIPFLQARIDFENGEAARYNQSITMFNNAYAAWANWYNRTHMPLGCGSFRF